MTGRSISTRIVPVTIAVLTVASTFDCKAFAFTLPSWSLSSSSIIVVRPTSATSTDSIIGNDYLHTTAQKRTSSFSRIGSGSTTTATTTTTTTGCCRQRRTLGLLFADTTSGSTVAEAPAADDSNDSPDDENDDDDELLPSDPASTTAQFLTGLWQLIAQGNCMIRGETKTVLFPNMAEQLLNQRYLNLVTAHLDSCKDVCDYYGISTTLQPFIQQGRVTGFTVKSFRNPNQDPDIMEFAYDPFWDDGDEDWDYTGIDDKYEQEEDSEGSHIGTSSVKPIKYPDIVNKIPDNDDDILRISKEWVTKICSDMGICPFTNGSEMAGLPVGPVYYTIDRSTSMEDMYARYWREVVRIEERPERDLSTTLLIAPEFCLDNVGIFENFSTTLTQPLTAFGVEDSIQLVFFHPHWSFRDGGERGGQGAAANYARRSPWPMINILRTNQVRAAQKGIPTGLVYKQNEKTLSGVGVEKLETMLRLRDWSDIADVKVDRRAVEALRVAQDYQQTGIVKQVDASFESDSTPAANKVDGGQIEQGNLVNVVKQALEKRLGKRDGRITRLSGPETSATIMASDFLLAELEKIIASYPAVP